MKLVLCGLAGSCMKKRSSGHLLRRESLMENDLIVKIAYGLMAIGLFGSSLGLARVLFWVAFNK